jgi:hypothetical protein
MYGSGFEIQQAFKKTTKLKHMYIHTFSVTRSWIFGFTFKFTRATTLLVRFTSAGANPAIVSYNASIVKRLEKHNAFFIKNVFFLA